MTKKSLKIIIVVLLCIFSISTYVSCERNKSLKNSLSLAISNEKAFVSENDSLRNQNKVFKFTIDKLNYYNDSILQKMNDVRKELRVKDKNLVSLQYISSIASKKDTIVFTDTIFKDKEFKVDTIVSDKWYNLKLELKYPNLIYAEPTFNSEKYIIVTKKKETINPPKKFFLFRWFQKKHYVLEVIVKDKNPYVKETNNKFIEIIK